MPLTHVESEETVIRRLRPEDLASVIAVDAKIVGRRRDEYFKVKLEQALAETGIQISLAADLQGCFVGFLLARVWYGEFGAPEPVAVLDTVGVHPDFKGRGVGTALIDQLCTNLRALSIPQLQTEVDWDSPELVGFFHRLGFHPAPRLCLDRDLETRSGEPV
jgi:ribosomal protein S18 acetylase RimI-like enzyme